MRDDVTVLLVSDEEGFLLVRDLISASRTVSGPGGCTLVLAKTPAEALDRLASGGPSLDAVPAIDACLLDGRLGGETAVSLAEALAARSGSVPVLLLTGGSEPGCAGPPYSAYPAHPADVAGVADVLAWSELTGSLLDRAIRLAIARRTVGTGLASLVSSGAGLTQSEDITERMITQERLRASRQTIRALLDASMDAAWLLDPNGTILALNAVAALQFGSTAARLEGRNLFDLIGPGKEDRLAIQREVQRTGRRTRFKDAWGGRLFDVSVNPILDENGEVGTVAVFSREISRERRLEELYRSMVEGQTEFICRYAPDTTLTFVNEAFARFLGVDSGDLVGRKFIECMGGAGQPFPMEYIADLSPDNPVHLAEHRVLQPDGTIGYYEWVDRAFFDEDGHIVEVQGAGRDITERIETEWRLTALSMESERLRLSLEAVLRSIPDAIVTVDKDLRVIHANRPLESICGRDWDIGRLRPLPALPGFEGSQCLAVLRQTVQTERPVKDFRVKCCKGVKPDQVLVLNCSPLRDSAGQFAGAVLIIRDVTRLHELERRLIERHSFQKIIGKSRRMQEIYSCLERLAGLETTVLVAGESGTGKELIVDALHHGGGRAGGPLIKVNCAALSESVLESELFGHVKGAFTGADRDKVGRFEAAHGGTLFLDEIGEIPLSVQLRLLRVLERKEYERVGESRTRRTDARIVAATNADLSDKVRRGEFRADLYYRLRVMVIELPPLRERTEDIPLLVAHFLENFRQAFDKPIDRPSLEAMRVLMDHAWPGNVRELRHSLEYACILCSGGDIQVEHLPRELLSLKRQDDPVAGPRPAPVDCGQDQVLDALRRSGWNKAKAARILGVSRLTMYNRMRKYGIEEEQA